MSEDINVGQILEVLNNKPDIDFQNVPSNSINITRCLTNVTNCITEIPQRIKLELNNGTLTLKAGSQVIVPNGKNADGSFKFDYINIEKDLSVTLSGSVSDTHFVCFNMNAEIDKIGWRILPTNCYSGSTEPTQTGQLYWYDTDTNIIKYYLNNEEQSSGFSFPLALCTRTEGIYTSINQVFNGMGYIGSTVWIDKGVKGLAPNGRNKDGTLNNIEITNDVIRTQTNPYGAVDSGIGAFSLAYVNGKVGFGILYRYIESTTEPTTTYTTWYNPNTNITKYRSTIESGWSLVNQCPVFSTRYNYDSSTKVNTFISLTPKQPFRAVNYNELDNIYNEFNNVYNELDNVIGNNTAPTPKAYITETYVNGTSWYRVWSDKWCEQGGRINAPTTSTSEITATLLKSYKDTSYTLVITQSNTTTTSYGITIKSQATNKFIISALLYDKHYANWYACGYIS